MIKLAYDKSLEEKIMKPLLETIYIYIFKAMYLNKHTVDLASDAGTREHSAPFENEKIHECFCFFSLRKIPNVTDFRHSIDDNNIHPSKAFIDCCYVNGISRTCSNTCYMYLAKYPLHSTLEGI